MVLLVTYKDKEWHYARVIRRGPKQQLDNQVEKANFWECKRIFCQNFLKLARKVVVQLLLTVFMM